MEDEDRSGAGPGLEAQSGTMSTDTSVNGVGKVFLVGAESREVSVESDVGLELWWWRLG